jgi:anti-sigma B factor antagonist
MSFSLARNGQAVEVTVRDQLVASNRQELKQAVLDELDRGARQFRIDFERTGYIDSAGLGVLVALSKRIRDQRGELRLAHLSDDLQSLFHLTKLDTLFVLDEEDGTAGRSAVLKPKPLGPLEGRTQVEPPPPEAEL